MQSEFRQLIRIGVWEGIRLTRMEKTQKVNPKFRYQSKSFDKLKDILRKHAYPYVDEHLLQAMALSIFHYVQATIRKFAKEELENAVIYQVKIRKFNNGKSKNGNNSDSSIEEIIEEWSYDEYVKKKREMKNGKSKLKNSEEIIETTAIRILHSFSEHVNDDYNYTIEEQISSLAKHLGTSVDLEDFTLDPETICIKKGI